MLFYYAIKYSAHGRVDVIGRALSLEYRRNLTWPLSLVSLVNLGKLLHLAETKFIGDAVKWFIEDNMVG